MPTLSIWEKETIYAHQDVLIVGAGLMGLWSALELKKKNKDLRITLLERFPSPLGASSRNAGFACFGSPTELLHDSLTMGTDAMLQGVENRYKGIEKIRNHFSESTIGYELCGGYECMNQSYVHWDQLNDQLEWLNQLLLPITGIDSIFKRVDAKLPLLNLCGFDALIENRTEAALHSGKLLQALTQKVRENGIQILNGVDVTHLEEQQSGIKLYTREEQIFSAEQVLCCTNAFTNVLLPQLEVTPARGQVLLTSPIPQLALKGTFHFQEGFYYWRHLGNRILIGGARNSDLVQEATTDFSGSAVIQKTLENFLRQHLNIPFEIEQNWSGVMGFTADKKPMVKRVSPHIVAAVACNGIGVAMTPIVAEEVAHMM